MNHGKIEGIFLDSSEKRHSLHIHTARFNDEWQNSKEYLSDSLLTATSTLSLHIVCEQARAYIHVTSLHNNPPTYFWPWEKADTTVA